VLGVSGSYSRLTFRSPRASALAPVHTATVLVFNGRVLAGRALSGFGEASLAGPIGAKEPIGTTVTINFTANFPCHLPSSMAGPKGQLRVY